MKAALIPPKGYYKTAEQSNYHLMLAQIPDADYRRMYAYMTDDNYIILDNGAAEGNAINDAALVRIAALIGVDEIVVPDVIGDYEGTIKRVDDFFTKVDLDKIDVNYMLVPQGKNYEEIIRCIDYYTERWQEKAVIGLPRHLLTTLDDRQARGNLCAYVATCGDIKVHLLGTSPVWPTEIKWIAHDYPWVRGVDSSMPYNYTIAGLELTGPAPIVPVSRPNRYFTDERKLIEGLLEYNINTFKEWASGTEGTSRQL